MDIKIPFIAIGAIVAGCLGYLKFKKELAYTKSKNTRELMLEIKKSTRRGLGIREELEQEILHSDLYGKEVDVQEIRFFNQGIGLSNIRFYLANRKWLYLVSTANVVELKVKESNALVCKMTSKAFNSLFTFALFGGLFIFFFCLISYLENKNEKLGSISGIIETMPDSLGFAFLLVFTFIFEILFFIALIAFAESLSFRRNVESRFSEHITNKPE